MSNAASHFLASRAFAMADQDWFAALTHDCNPMHVDPLAARRTQFGLPVVHGVHTLLWALDVLCAVRPELHAAGMQVRFVKPVLVGDTISLAITGEKSGEVTLTGAVGSVASLSIRLTQAEPRGIPAAAAKVAAAPTPIRTTAAEVPVATLMGHCGAFRYPATRLAAAFPAAARVLGAEVVAGLAASTYVVGMECPGLHSIYSGITAALRSSGAADLMHFSVTKFDPRFRMAEVALHAPGLTASLSVFARMPPVLQPGMAELARMVVPGEFAGQQALVVGGSRGIGEVTAKLLAAGGAQVAVTYASGSADATRVTNDIIAAGGAARALRYDVREPADAQIVALGFAPNALYYCATGPVFRRKLALYEPEVMHEFQSFYVDGFYDLCLALQRRSGADLVAFYPSTVAVEAPVKDLAEYSAAKLAGEMLCSHLTAFAKGITVVVNRLPRTNTDLTATVAQTEAAEPADVMLPILRDVQSKRIGEGAPQMDAQQ